jgi:hypothetical protein
VGKIKSANVGALTNNGFQNKILSQIIFSEKEYLNFIILDVKTLEQTSDSEVLHFYEYQQPIKS